MLVRAELAKDIQIPSVEAPTPAEKCALTALAERLQSVAASALSRFSALPARVGEVRWEIGAPDSQARAIEARWGQPDLQWVLLMEYRAAEAVLAGMLGFSTLAPSECLTPTDLELLQLPLRQLAGQMQAELAQPAGAVDLGDVGQLPRAECVCLRFDISVGESVGTAMLLVAWESLRRLYRRADAGSRTLGLRALEGVSMRLDASMPGGEPTLQQLLDLQPGDVLQLGPLDLQTVVTANGKDFARGKVGAKGEHLAVHITEIAAVREGLS